MTKNRLSAFFGKDETMRISVVFTCLFAAADMVLIAGSSPDITAIMSDAVLTGCMIFMYRAYRRHEKNSMKNLIGAVMMWILLSHLDNISELIQNGTWPRIHAVLDVVLLAAVMAMFIIHIFINSDRRSSPVKVFANQCAMLLVFLISVAQTVICFALPEDRIMFSAWYLMIAFLLSTVVCIESKLDGFRIAREAAGWTPDTNK